MEVSTERRRAKYPRAARMSGGRQFASVLRRGRRVGDRHFSMVFRPNGEGHARLGFAISRRRVPTAVGRNRLKRTVRESFQKARRELPPVDIVVMANPAAAAADSGALQASLERCWDNIRRGPRHPKSGQRPRKGSD